MESGVHAVKRPTQGRTIRRSRYLPIVRSGIQDCAPIKVVARHELSHYIRTTARGMASEVFSVRLHCFARHDAKVRIGQQKDEYRIRAHQPDTYRIAIHRNQAGYLCVVIESTPLLRGTVGHLIESLDFPGDER